MELRTLKHGESPECVRLWDAFVLNHGEASTGHLSANFRLADALGAGNRSLLVLDEKDRVRAALPLLKECSQKMQLFRVRMLTSGVVFPAHPLT